MGTFVGNLIFSMPRPLEYPATFPTSPILIRNARDLYFLQADHPGGRIAAATGTARLFASSPSQSREDSGSGDANRGLDLLAKSLKGERTENELQRAQAALEALAALLTESAPASDRWKSMLLSPSRAKAILALEEIGKDPRLASRIKARFSEKHVKEMLTEKSKEPSEIKPAAMAETFPAANLATLEKAARNLENLLASPSLSKSGEESALESMKAIVRACDDDGKEVSLLRSCYYGAIAPFGAFYEGPLADAAIAVLRDRGLKHPRYLVVQAARMALEFVVSAGNETSAGTARKALTQAGHKVRSTTFGNTVLRILDRHLPYLTERHVERLIEELALSPSTLAWRSAVRSLGDISERAPKPLGDLARHALMSPSMPTHIFVLNLDRAADSAPDIIRTDMIDRLQRIILGDSRPWLRTRAQAVLEKIRRLRAQSRDPKA